MASIADLEIVVNGNTSDAESKLDSLDKKVSKFSSGDKLAASAGLMGIGAGVAGFFGAAIGSAANFEQALSNIASVGGPAAASQMDAIKAKALELGSSTQYSATEAADGMAELIKAGMPLEDVMNGGGQAVLDFAAATDIGVGQASEMIADMSNTFGLSATQIADNLAATANVSSASVTDLQYSLAQAGSTAKSMGIPFEDLNATLGVLANSGIKGEQAGTTSLKNMLTSLASPTAEQAALLNQLGISAFDSAGNFVGMENVVGQLQGAWAGLTQEQKLQYAEMLVGKEGMAGFMALMESGTGSITKMKEETKAAGTANQMAAAKMDNLKGAIETLKGALETAMIIIGSMFIPALRMMAEALSQAVVWFTKLPSGVQKTAAIVLGAIGAFAALAGALGLASTLAGPLAAGIALLTSPVMLVVAAIAALGVGLVLAYKHIDGFRTAVNSVFGVLSNFAKYLKDVWTGGDTFAKSLQKLPAPLRTAAQAVGVIVDAFRDLKEAFSAGGLKGLMSALPGELKQIGGAFKTLGSEILSGLRAIDWGAVGSVLVSGVRSGLSMLGGLAAGAWTWLTNSLKAVDWSGIASEIGNKIKSALSSISGSGIWDWLKNSLQSAFDGISSAVGQGIQLAWDKIQDINWSQFIPNVNWSDFISKVADLGSWIAQKITSLPWHDFITGAWDIASKTGSYIKNLPWSDFISGTWDIATKIGSYIKNLPWSDFISGVWDIATSIGTYIKSLPWSDFISGVWDITTSIGTYIKNLPWSDFISGVWDITTSIGTYIKNLPWSDFISGVWDIATNIGSYIKNLPWGDFISGSWDIATNIGSYIKSLPWGDFISGSWDIVRNIGSYIKSLPWGDFITGTVDIATKVVEAIGDLGGKILDKLGVQPLPKIDVPSKQDILDFVFGWAKGGGQSDASARWNDHQPWGGNPTGGGDGFRGPTPLSAGGGISQYIKDAGSGSGGFNASLYTTAFTTVTTAAQTMAATVGAMLTALASGFIATGGLISSAVTTWGTSLTTFSTSVATTSATVGAQLTALATGFISTGTLIAAAIVLWSTPLTTFATTVGTTASAVGAQLTALATGFIATSTLVGTALTTMGTALNTARTNVTSFVSGAASSLSSFASSTTSNVSTAARAFSSTLPSALNAGSSAMNSFRSTASSVMSGVVSAVSSGMSQASSAVQSNAERWPSIVAGVGGGMYSAGYSIGAQASAGVAAGLYSALGAVTAAANALVAEVARAMAAKAQIHSPSKLTAKLGEYMGMGFVEGMNATLGDVSRAGANLAGAAIPNVGAGMYGTGYNGNVGTSVTNNQTFNVTIDARDLKEYESAIAFFQDLSSSQAVM